DSCLRRIQMQRRSACLALADPVVTIEKLHRLERGGKRDITWRYLQRAGGTAMAGTQDPRSES
ncbi:MAG: hypothetical protein WBM68_03250, partial [Woeseia sp.]